MTHQPTICFLNGPILASFCCLLSSFSHYNLNNTIEAYDGVLWIQTHGRRMVGADDTTEQWRPTIRSNDYLKYTIKV